MSRFEMVRSESATCLRDDIYSLIKSKYRKAGARDLIAGMAQFLAVSCISVGVKRKVFLEYLDEVWSYVEKGQSSPVAKA